MADMTIYEALYTTGRWGTAKRRPAHEVAYRNHWGDPFGIDIPEPLWTPK